MTICQRCHRPLRVPSPDGYGPVCRKSVAPIPAVERDLFGFDIERAEAAARSRSDAGIAASIVEGVRAVRELARAARGRLGVA